MNRCRLKRPLVTTDGRGAYNTYGHAYPEGTILDIGWASTPGVVSVSQPGIREFAPVFAREADVLAACGLSSLDLVLAPLVRRPS